MQKSNIPWCTHTWNPFCGCTKVATGCRNCYARDLHTKRHIAYLAGKKLPVQYAKPFSEIQLLPDRLDEPIRCRAKDAKIFVCSMSDLFHDKVPRLFIGRVLNVIECCKQHTFQILTKRPEMALETMKAYYNNEQPIPNLWLGTSISTQADADKNIPILLQIPAAVRFVSFEPMLERIEDVCHGFPRPQIPFSRKMIDGWFWEELDWLIIGSESGPKRRPCKLEWVKDVIEQCDAAGVAPFVKQLDINGKVSKKMEEWPEWARRQEYPK